MPRGQPTNQLDAPTRTPDARYDVPPDRRNGDGGRSLAYWILIALSLGVLAPCVLLPAWRENQRAELRHRLLAGRVAQLEARLERQRRLLDALDSDPAVITRAAMRELDYTQPGERFVSVAAAQSPPATPDLPVPAVKPLPVGLSRLARFLPDWNYDAVFNRQPIRRILMAMAVALLAAAFVIFWPRCRVNANQPAGGTPHPHGNTAENPG